MITVVIFTLLSLRQVLLHGIPYVVRGYMNLLFSDNIVEKTNPVELKKIAKNNRYRYALYVELAEKEGSNNIYKILGAEVYDIRDDSTIKLKCL